MNTSLAETEPTEPDLDACQRIVLHGIPWKQYLALRRIDDRPGLRMTYLEGTLEIMSPSELHEDVKTKIARLLETWAMEMRVDLQGYGSTTYRSKAKQRGLEPDECYCIDGLSKKCPDIAIEVNLSSGGIDKLEVYRGLGVQEVWIWSCGRLTVHRLGKRGYTAHQRSTLLPQLDLDLLVSFLGIASQTQAALAYRDALRARG